jgi:transposase
LDVHKRYTYATILGPDGEILAQKKMPNEEVPGFLEPCSVEHVAMEATTSIAPLYRRLEREGYDIHIAHLKKTRTIAKARIKTDRTSSRALAELLRVNGLPESYWPPPHVALLREKIRRRAFLVRQRAKLKTKIRSVLTYQGVKPPTEFGLFTRRGVEWLLGLGLEPVDCYLRLMPPLSREILALSRMLRQMAEGDEDVRLLMTIPGIGYYTALLKGGGRRGGSYSLQGDDGQLLRSGAQHQEQRRSHPPRPRHQGGEQVAQVGPGGGCLRPP